MSLESKSRVSIDGFLRKLGKVSKCLRKACAKLGCDEGRSMRHDWRIACEANVEQAGDEGSCRGMKRKGKKACGEGDGRWRRLYSFTRSFIVRTHRLGGLQSLWLIQNSRHDRRVYVYVFFFFRPFFLSVYARPRRRRRRRISSSSSSSSWQSSPRGFRPPPGR